MGLGAVGRKYRIWILQVYFQMSQHMIYFSKFDNKNIIMFVLQLISLFEKFIIGRR